MVAEFVDVAERKENLDYGPEAGFASLFYFISPSDFPFVGAESRRRIRSGQKTGSCQEKASAAARSRGRLRFHS